MKFHNQFRIMKFSFGPGLCWPEIENCTPKRHLSPKFVKIFCEFLKIFFSKSDRPFDHKMPEHPSG